MYFDNGENCENNGMVEIGLVTPKLGQKAYLDQGQRENWRI